ncbi:hypothetical protein GLOIN_2v1030945 [Rhizophagus clarus]|uniref:Actin-like ATPase domain-containing protein n=1 Tax=Rhizophagus clarus TaxID=94130 RepID=A0A8H3L7C9_9GLOM|nr:hypothetical protein GLOIN_2v1030945 [Rhizophagus clarus]
MGNPTLAQKQSKDLFFFQELFELHLGNISQNENFHQLSYEKAISDYLCELGKLIKETISTRWQGIIFFEHVLLIISIPAEFDDRAKDTMRKCLHNAGLTNSKESNKVEFTTEPEAAAIYCMRNIKEQNETILINASFMIVDCGGGTVDLTTRKLLQNERLSEITERTGDFCGGSYVDREFIKFLSRKLEICPVLKQYCNEDIKEKMEDNDWIFDINFEDLKSMFDPVIGKIIRLIRGQFDSKEFGRLVPSIIIPKQPVAAIVRGACDYGLEMSTIVDRTLKYTYGFRTYRNWVDGDPIDRKKIFEGNNKAKIAIFHCFVTRGTKVGIDKKFSTVRIPIEPDQTEMSFLIYKTTKSSAEFCDEPDMK